jgi:hypothetical protein
MLRKKRIARANYEEKLDHEFLPYILVEQMPKIERLLFDKHSSNGIGSISALRDRFLLELIRFCLLMTFCGILRGESTIKAELSDMCSFVLDAESENPCLILVMRIAVGKTNGLKVLYGKSF